MENSYEQILARLNTAKSNFNNEGQPSSKLAALSKEFDSIAQTFKSLPSSFTIKAQIEACENYSKICEEKRIIRQTEEYKENHLYALDRLNTAKQKIKNHKEGAEYFTELGKAFAAIEQAFRSLPNSFDVKSQIEECKESRRRCEESQKRCEEKQQRSLEKPQQRRKVGRGISVFFALLATIMAFIINSYDPTGIFFVIILAFINLIPFLVIFFADKESEVKKGVFLCIGIGISIFVLSVYSGAGIPEALIASVVLSICNLVSCITAIIFKND